MEIRVDSLDFSQPLRGSGPRTAQKTLVFPRDVVSAVAGLSGYLTEFSGGDDHHVGLLDVRLSTQVNGDTVTVTGTFGLRDWSGDWDDNYDGSINFVVVAELVSATAPPPRGDLSITGVEFNQATQFFRASRFLDAANVHPDNSVFLIAGRNTGVRVYVDYDASSGLPPIAALSGQLVVTSTSGTTTISPLNSTGIAPKRDVNINQALANDTLNFMIQRGFSTGTATVTCRVFDQANPSQVSHEFTRTIVFTQVEPLNIFLVGVQTLSPAAPAPSQTAVAGAFSLLQKTYPRSLIQFTGFNTITLAPPIVGLTASSGCGSGWNTLLDQLKDLKGGSGDIYFGGLPAGIFTAGVVGCSPVGDRVAASFIDLIVTVPHEVGHSLGRRHDPCRGCSPAAQDPDNNYPQYDTFNSDSIGVFGFDPTTNTVFNPANTLDFMTAFVQPVSSTWISPYTHQGLLGPAQGGPSGAGAMTLARGQHNLLFLGLEISRKREVTRRVSFHYMAVDQGSSRCETQFTYELLDADRKVLDCGILHCLCSSDCRCWPKTTRDVVPYPDGAGYLAVYDDDDQQIYEEEILKPPSVEIVEHNVRKDGIELKWRASNDALAFLVHYRDVKTREWRGVAPRQDTNSLLMPWTLFRESTLAVRVLASSGIATGHADIELRVPNYSQADVSLRMVSVGPIGDQPIAIDAAPYVLATDASGAQVSEEYISWYDGSGGSLGRGRQVDLRTLADGRHVIRAVVRSHGGRTVGKSWVVERRGSAYFVHAVMPDPARSLRQPMHQHPHPAPPRYKE